MSFLNFALAHQETEASNSPQVPTFPLSFMNAGNVAQITNIRGKDQVKRHLDELGLVIGTEVSMVSKSAGCYILNVKGSRLAVTPDLASRIFIKNI